jgi:uncharacterized protein YjbI with pentapeptide repeats
MITRPVDTSVDQRPANGVRNPTSGAVLRGAIAFVVAALLHLAIGFYTCADATCPNPNTEGPDYSGQNLVWPNFSHQNLRYANFSNAHLTSPNFIGADLFAANFSGATIDTANSISPDFSFANLTYACFNGAKIGDPNVPAYFEYATLTCADFSEVPLIDGQNNNLLIFGESLKIHKDPNGDPTKLTCRTAFRSDPMNCEFIDDWRWLDLDGAHIDACLSQLRGKVFSGGQFRGVNFSGGSSTQTDLTNTKWQSSELNGANFNYATLENADFTNARLMSISDRPPERLGATFDFASLNNAVFVGADLSNTYFAGATLTGPNVKLTGATLTGSDWDHANLSGVDLNGVKAWGANFAGATLDSTTLKNTDLGYNSYKATGTNQIKPAELGSATLCGATLDATILTCADLTGAHILNATPTANCADATISKTATGEYSTKTEGGSSRVICSTTCPDGKPGPCVSAEQWQSQTPVGKQCCVWKQGDPPCPPRKKPGVACAVDCDCASQHCSANGDKGKVCASNADLTRALLRDQTERRQ